MGASQVGIEARIAGRGAAWWRRARDVRRANRLALGLACFILPTLLAPPAVKANPPKPYGVDEEGRAYAYFRVKDRGYLLREPYACGEQVQGGKRRPNGHAHRGAQFSLARSGLAP